MKGAIDLKMSLLGDQRSKNSGDDGGLAGKNVGEGKKAVTSGLAGLSEQVTHLCAEPYM